MELLYSKFENTKVRDLILDGEIEKAEKEIKEVEKAKGDSNHPLNFKNAGDEEFAKATGRQSSDEEPYNKFLDDSVSGLMSLAGQKKLKSAVEEGLPLELLVVELQNYQKNLNLQVGLIERQKVIWKFMIQIIPNIELVSV